MLAKRTYDHMGHFMMEMEFPVRRGVVRSVNPSDYFSPIRGAADIRQILIAKGFNDVVEVFSCGCSMEAT